MNKLEVQAHTNEYIGSIRTSRNNYNRNGREERLLRDDDDVVLFNELIRQLFIYITGDR